MHVVVGRPPAGHGRVGERCAGEEGAVLPVAEVQRERDAGDGAEPLGETEAVQHLDGVRAEGEARADLAQHAGLLVDVDVEARLPQGEGGRQAADPGAHDEHAHRASLLRKSSDSGRLFRRRDDRLLPSTARMGLARTLSSAGAAATCELPRRRSPPPSPPPTGVGRVMRDARLPRCGRTVPPLPDRGRRLAPPGRQPERGHQLVAPELRETRAVVGRLPPVVRAVEAEAPSDPAPQGPERASGRIARPPHVPAAEVDPPRERDGGRHRCPFPGPRGGGRRCRSWQARTPRGRAARLAGRSGGRACPSTDRPAGCPAGGRRRGAGSRVARAPPGGERCAYPSRRAPGCQGRCVTDEPLSPARPDQEEVPAARAPAAADGARMQPNALPGSDVTVDAWPPGGLRDVSQRSVRRRLPRESNTSAPTAPLLTALSGAASRSRTARHGCLIWKRSALAAMCCCRERRAW